MYWKSCSVRWRCFSLVQCHVQLSCYFTGLFSNDEILRILENTCVKNQLLSSSVTGLRFPLMWRDSDHFNNRGSKKSGLVFSRSPFVLVCCPLWIFVKSLLFEFVRLSEDGAVLYDASWFRGVWHRDGGGGQISYWRLLRGSHHLVSIFFFSFIKNIYYCKCFVFKCNFHSKSRRSAFVWTEGGAVELRIRGRAHYGKNTEETRQEASKLIWKIRWEEAVPPAGHFRPWHLPAVPSHTLVRIRLNWMEGDFIYSCVNGGSMCVLVNKCYEWRKKWRDIQCPEL